jgi:hypothetical protein
MSNSVHETSRIHNLNRANESSKGKAKRKPRGATRDEFTEARWFSWLSGSEAELKAVVKGKSRGTTMVESTY